MVYASFVTGNRPSGANPDATVFPESDSEQIEIGTRNVLFGGALRLNATFFYKKLPTHNRVLSGSLLHMLNLMTSRMKGFS